MLYVCYERKPCRRNCFYYKSRENTYAHAESICRLKIVSCAHAAWLSLWEARSFYKYDVWPLTCASHLKSIVLGFHGLVLHHDVCVCGFKLVFQYQVHLTALTVCFIYAHVYMCKYILYQKKPNIANIACFCCAYVHCIYLLYYKPAHKIWPRFVCMLSDLYKCFTLATFLVLWTSMPSVRVQFKFWRAKRLFKDASDSHLTHLYSLISSLRSNNCH